MMVGFKLPAGAITHALAPFQQDVHPWGLDGGSWDRPDPDMLGDETVAEIFYRDLNARYPGGLSIPGLKHPEFKAALEKIAKDDPGFFKRMKLGAATGDKEASKEETFDLQAWKGRDIVMDRARELFELDGAGEPVKPVKPQPTPPVTPPPPPSSGTLSPVSQRVEELRSLAEDLLGTSGNPLAALLLSFFANQSLWESGMKPILTTALLMLRSADPRSED